MNLDKHFYLFQRCFNSSMVRLIFVHRWFNVSTCLWFQFLNGSIDICTLFVKFAKTNEFQFLNGSIDIRKYLTLRFSFVRCFNSSMVRLILDSIADNNMRLIGFNSSMVRLILNLDPHRITIIRVSIPQWFD